MDLCRLKKITRKKLNTHKCQEYCLINHDHNTLPYNLVCGIYFTKNLFTSGIKEPLFAILCNRLHSQPLFMKLNHRLTQLLVNFQFSGDFFHYNLDF